MLAKSAFWIIIIFMFTGCSVTNHPVKDCSSLREGSFLLNLYNPSGMGHWRHISINIVRKDSIEYHLSSFFPVDTSFYRLKWNPVNGCSYNAVLLNPSHKLDSFIVSQHPEGQIHQIIKLSADYYLDKRTGVFHPDTVWFRK